MAARMGWRAKRKLKKTFAQYATKLEAGNTRGQRRARQSSFARKL